MILFRLNILHGQPDSKSRLFPARNPICLVFKVLLQDGFLFYYRSSGCSPLLIRSEIIIQRLKPLVYKDYMNTELTIYIHSASPVLIPTLSATSFALQRGASHRNAKTIFDI